MNRKTCLLLITAIVAFLTVSPTLYAQSRGNKLEATFWAGIDSDGSPFVFEFQESGKFKYVPTTGVISKGKWKLKGNSVDIEINGKFVKFIGNVENGRVADTASSRAGRKWKWSATKQPIVATSSAPKYPPIAVAARAMGNVVVEVQIDADGTVTSARALSGHPLLQKVSVDAAKSWRFAPSSEKSNIRTAQITFIFRVLANETDDSNVKSPVFLSPYQAEIKRATPTLDFTTSDSMVKRK